MRQNMWLIHYKITTERYLCVCTTILHFTFGYIKEHMDTNINIKSMDFYILWFQYTLLRVFFLAAVSICYLYSVTLVIDVLLQAKIPSRLSLTPLHQIYALYAGKCAVPTAPSTWTIFTKWLFYVRICVNVGKGPIRLIQHCKIQGISRGGLEMK